MTLVVTCTKHTLSLRLFAWTLEACHALTDCITSLNLCWSLHRPSSLHMLANFGNLQQLQLRLRRAKYCQLLFQPIGTLAVGVLCC